MFYSKSTGGFYSRDIHGENIPLDAVEITAEKYKKLLDSQAHGQSIQSDCEGRPVAVNHVLTTDELASVARLQRDALLSACDWTQCRDVPDAVAKAWQPYRKALRDLTVQAEFPSQITWPVACEVTFV